MVNKHLAGKLAIEENSGDRRSDHPDQKIEREPKWSPGALETVANEPEKPERDDDQTARMTADPRNKNVGDQPPDFTCANARDIEGEIRIESPVFKKTRTKTSALKVTTARINPGIAMKPRRRSSLSRKLIVAFTVEAAERLFKRTARTRLIDTQKLGV